MPATIPTLRAGEKHSLAAQMDGAHIKVSIDGTLVWQGSADSEALSVDGPVGLRSDNARFLFEFLAPSNSSTSPPSSCRSGPAEVE
jgi:hypothetical protein